MSSKRYKSVAELIRSMDPGAPVEKVPAGFTRHVAAMVQRLETEKAELVMALEVMHALWDNTENFRDSTFRVVPPAVAQARAALVKAKGGTS